MKKTSVLLKKAECLVECFKSLALIIGVNVNETKAEMMRMFQQYKIKFEVSNLKILEISGNKARVAFTQKATKVSGPAFTDNIVNGIHTLMKSKGVWRLYSTQLTDARQI